MRVLQLGVGSVGEVTARTLASIPEVSAVVLADIDEQRLAQVAPRLAAGKAELRPLDVEDTKALVAALVDVDLVINALIPEYNLDVMNACLETGTHYLDMAAAGPRDIVGTADVDEELALDADFKRRGLTGLVFFGMDPGASDVFARAPRSVRHSRGTDGLRRRQQHCRRSGVRARLLPQHNGGGMPYPATALL
jgi:saccharopine dehydrogenase-like NADP-dependent oxidoreductase